MTTTEAADFRAHLPADTPRATDALLVQLAGTVRDRREHDHHHGGITEDLYCMNLAAYAGERMGTVLARLAAAEDRLDVIAAKTAPCPPPDVANGYDSCQHGPWPCPATEVAWIAAGLDVAAQVAAAAREWRARMAEALLGESAGDDDAHLDECPAGDPGCNAPADGEWHSHDTCTTPRTAANLGAEDPTDRQLPPDLERRLLAHVEAGAVWLGTQTWSTDPAAPVHPLDQLDVTHRTTANRGLEVLHDALTGAAVEHADAGPDDTGERLLRLTDAGAADLAELRQARR